MIPESECGGIFEFRRGCCAREPAREVALSAMLWVAVAATAFGAGCNLAQLRKHVLQSSLSAAIPTGRAFALPHALPLPSRVHATTPSVYATHTFSNTMLRHHTSM